MKYTKRNIIEKWKVVCKKTKVTPELIGTTEQGALIYTLKEFPTAKYTFNAEVLS